MIETVLKIDGMACGMKFCTSPKEKNRARERSRRCCAASSADLRQDFAGCGKDDEQG